MGCNVMRWAHTELDLHSVILFLPVEEDKLLLVGVSSQRFTALHGIRMLFVFSVKNKQLELSWYPSIENNSFDLCVNTFGYVPTLFLALWNWRMCIRPCVDDVPKGVQFCEELVHGLAALIHHLQHDHQAVPRHNLQQTQSKSSEHGWKTSLNKEYISTDV